MNERRVLLVLNNRINLFFKQTRSPHVTESKTVLDSGSDSTLVELRENRGSVNRLCEDGQPCFMDNATPSRLLG